LAERGESVSPVRLNRIGGTLIIVSVKAGAKIGDK
jgi:hypothetical protein